MRGSAKFIFFFELLHGITFFLIIILVMATFFLIVSLVCYGSSLNDYNTEKSISDGAQLNTLAFDCLAFLTGNTCADSFIPPGKVADYFGFQHYRDNTPNGMGHNSDFLTFCAFNVIEILNQQQLALISENAAAEVALVHQYAYDRYPLMVAFRRHLEGDHTTDLSQSAVTGYSADPLYTLDANITITRAYVFSQVIESLNSTQKTLLDAMVSGGYASWPKVYDTDKIDRNVFKGNAKTQIMTFCSELFSWYAGDIDSDTYFAPERQANYFGSFFFKDAPAMGTRNYTIDEKLTADKGKYLLDYVLNTQQRTLLENLIEVQRDDLMGIVYARRNISRELRLYFASGYDTVHDIDIDFVYEQSKQYGEHDGNISYYYTMTFGQIYDSLNSSQWTHIHSLRNLDDYPCEQQNIYLYSRQIDRPDIQNTDFLFIPDTAVQTTLEPTNQPTKSPTRKPTDAPTTKPTDIPTTRSPTAPGETRSPTVDPTLSPSSYPTRIPSIATEVTRFPTHSRTEMFVSIETSAQTTDSHDGNNGGSYGFTDGVRMFDFPYGTTEILVCILSGLILCICLSVALYCRLKCKNGNESKSPHSTKLVEFGTITPAASDQLFHQNTGMHIARISSNTEFPDAIVRDNDRGIDL
eukprot:357933_1